MLNDIHWNILASVPDILHFTLTISFQGGLISDLQRLLPLDSGSDLYLVKYPDVPASLLYYVRPFQPADEEAVYALSADAYERTIDAPMGKSVSQSVRTFAEQN